MEPWRACLLCSPNSSGRFSGNESALALHTEAETANAWVDRTGQPSTQTRYGNSTALASAKRRSPVGAHTVLANAISTFQVAVPPN
jgi:hypothetical protein